MTRRAVGLIFVLVTAACGSGCASMARVIAEAPLTWSMQSEADDRLDAMASAPRPVTRPIVILAGLYDPGIGSNLLATRLERVLAADAPILALSFVGAPTFDACRDRVIAEVNEAWPSDDPNATIEVDVVAISMGGLVARYAARPAYDEPRLRVRRLFTICTPHLGAQLAGFPTIDQRIIDMRPGSALLSFLNGMPAADDPAIVAYARPGDLLVGDRYATPPSGEIHWFTPGPFEDAHINAAADPRILEDIARRLRVESRPHASSKDSATAHAAPAEWRESSTSPRILCHSVHDARTSSPDS